MYDRFAYINAAVQRLKIMIRDVKRPIDERMDGHGQTTRLSLFYYGTLKKKKLAR